jgi:hypothetical protein
MSWPILAGVLAASSPTTPQPGASASGSASSFNLAPPVASTTIGVLAANTPRRRFHPRAAALTTGHLAPGWRLA